LGGLGAALAYTESTRASSVVVVAHTIPRGEQVSAADLGVISMPVPPGVNSLPSSQLSSLVGKQALVDLPQGSLVGAGTVGMAPVTPGTEQLGLKLAAGRLPVRDMPAGTKVLLVSVTGKSDGVASSDIRVEATVVTAPAVLADGSAWVLDVAVPSASAQQVADLESRDQLSVVRQD